MTVEFEETPVSVQSPSGRRCWCLSRDGRLVVSSSCSVSRLWLLVACLTSQQSGQGPLPVYKRFILLFSLSKHMSLNSTWFIPFKKGVIYFGDVSIGVFC